MAAEPGDARAARSDGDAVQRPARGRDAAHGGAVLLDPRRDGLARAPVASGAAAATAGEDVAELSAGDQLLELGHGRRGVAAVEPADRDDRLAGGDDDRRRGLRPAGGHEVLRAALVGGEVADE